MTRIEGAEELRDGLDELARHMEELERAAARMRKELDWLLRLADRLTSATATAP